MGAPIISRQQLEKTGAEFISKLNQKFLFNGHQHLVFEIKSYQQYEHPIWSDLGLEHLEEIYETYGKRDRYVACLVRSMSGGVIGVVPKLVSQIQKLHSFTLVELEFVQNTDDPVAIIHEIGHSLGAPHTTQETNQFAKGATGLLNYKDILKDLPGHNIPMPKYDFKFYIAQAGKFIIDESIDPEVEDCSWNTASIMYPYVQKQASFFSHNDCGYSYAYSHIFNYYYELSQEVL
jgi:hypothetical protein